MTDKEKEWVLAISIFLILIIGIVLLIGAMLSLIYFNI